MGIVSLSCCARHTWPVNPQHVEFGETHVFVGPRFVVSVRHGSLQSHVGLRERCEASKHLLAKGPGFVLYALMDFVVDQYFPILEALEEKVVELEEVVLDEKFIHETTSRIYHLKRELLSIKRAVSPLVDICSRLMRFDLALLSEDTKPYYRDVYDHAMRINEMADTLREVLATALDANLSVISVSQNKDTKRLAAWAAIIAAPTAIAGIYGMNFQYMPITIVQPARPVARLLARRRLRLPGDRGRPGAGREYTSRGNLVGVITNGTAVLGLGDIGPLAGKPVMEGKGCLFKKFAGIDVFDIELAEHDPDKLVEIIAALEPTLRRHQPRGHQGAGVLLHREEAARAHEDPGLPRRPARHGDHLGRRAAQRPGAGRQADRRGQAGRAPAPAPRRSPAST